MVEYLGITENLSRVAGGKMYLFGGKASYIQEAGTDCSHNLSFCTENLCNMKCSRYIHGESCHSHEYIQHIRDDYDCEYIILLLVFTDESAKSATGLVEWDSKGEALEALFAANHAQVPNPSK